MQKLIIKNKYQSPNRINILTAAGIAQINEPIFPQNGERIWGGLGVVTFNQASQYNEEESPNDPITPPDCPNCGGGIEPEPVPSGNCEKKNISELKQVLDDYANQSFCDKEFPEVQFSTFIGYDKPPSDSTAKEIELRMLCPSDDCSDGTFWTPGSANPTYEAIYDVLGYRENCRNIYAQPYLKVKKLSPCEIFEKHKAYFKQIISSPTPPCECSKFYWRVTFNYGGTSYNERLEGLSLPDALVDEVTALVLSTAYEHQGATSGMYARFACYCDDNASCTSNGKRFFYKDFTPNLYIDRLYEENCQNIKCESGCVNASCYDNPDCHCYFGNERIYESCCNGG